MGSTQNTFLKWTSLRFRWGTEREITIAESCINSFINEVHSRGLKKPYIPYGNEFSTLVLFYPEGPTCFGCLSPHTMPWVIICFVKQPLTVFFWNLCLFIFLRVTQYSVRDIMSDCISQTALSCVSNDCQSDWYNWMWHTITLFPRLWNMRWIWGQEEKSQKICKNRKWI